MYKILILVEPAEGHFNPFVPIIKKLVEKSHDVVCITARYFQKRVENTGATFIPIPQKWDFGDKEPYEAFPELKKRKGLSQIKYYIKHIMFDPIPDAIYMLNKVLEKFPADLVISDSFMVAGVWITELGGPPNIRLSVLPLSLPGKDIAPFGLGLLPGKSFISKMRNNILRIIFERFIFRDINKYGNKIRNEVGLPPYDKSLFIKGYELPNLVFHTSIPGFEYPRKRFPDNFRFIGPVIVPPSEDYIKPEWWSEVEKKRPVILINQGTVARNYDDLINPAIEALKNENMVVVAVPVKDEIKNLPANTYVDSYIPFGNLLPHVDLMITNGGFGGTQNALARGIPIVIAGATEDKMEVAARVEHSGAGINLRRQNPSPSDIKKAVNKIFSDTSYKQRAIELQNEYAKYNAPELAVKYIEELIEKM